ncbi:hypothetical protein K9L05_03460 [Candidatus Babeliales bacterium]|nr:hypothetical protein [Candidatus Babeliales bacterium]MCF7899678.1 hypothetical protein [Candidatus Babeliales bacterium]
MKKIIFYTLLCLFLLTPNFNFLGGRGGGESFAGGLAGGMVGGLLTGAMTKDSGSSRRAEEEARRAQDQTEQLRRDQEREARRLQEHTEQLRREREQEKLRALEEKLTGQQGSKQVTTILMILLAIFFAAVVALSFMIFRKHGKKE